MNNRSRRKPTPMILVYFQILDVFIVSSFILRIKIIIITTATVTDDNISQITNQPTNKKIR